MKRVDSREMPAEVVRAQAQMLKQSPCVVCSGPQATIRKVPWGEDVAYVPLCAEHSMLHEDRLLAAMRAQEC